MHLKTTFAEELISRAERYLNDSGKFSHLFCSIVLNVGNTLEQPNSWIILTKRDNREVPRSKL
jgi:hypothetical protein